MAYLLRLILLLSVVHCSLCGSNEVSKEIGNAASNSLKHKSSTEYVALDKGQTNVEEKAKYAKADADSHGHDQNSGSYNEQDTKQGGHEGTWHSAGESQAYDKAKNAYEKSSSGQERKGYHRSGFVHNYHKDESGNNSSFYEDSSDENAHRGQDVKDEYYGKKSEDAFKDGRHESAYVGHDRVNKGDFDKGERYHDQHGHVGNYNANNYDEAKRNYAHDGAERHFDRNGNEIYYRQEYQPHRHPYEYPYHYPHTMSYPPDYYHNYPQDFHYNYPPRYFLPYSDYHKNAQHHPTREGHYSNSYDDYYGVGYDSGYSNRYSSGYQPQGVYEEYVRTY